MDVLFPCGTAHHSSEISLFRTTLGAFLSHKLGWPLHEGDDFHPRENVDKMARGEPLTDQDRLPWLLKLHDVIQRERSSGGDAIMVCSALRRLYRQVLLFGSEALTYSSDTAGLHMCSLPGVWFLFLYGTYDLIHARMVARRGHFMQPGLLRSQFDVLEPPAEEEKALLLDIRRSTDDICREIQEHLRQLS
uniref:Gluconokinase n=1 Tax=Oncorhynchus mykiss TaxID=8022 RepID=A0A8C7T1Y6_ONCMY